MKNWLRNVIRSIETHPKTSVEEVLRGKYSSFELFLDALDKAADEALSMRGENRLAALGQKMAEVLRCLGSLTGSEHPALAKRVTEAIEGGDSFTGEDAAGAIKVAHDTAIDEMSTLMDRYSADRMRTKKVKTGLSINLHVLDLDGSLSAFPGKLLPREAINSLPLQAMFRGMYYPGVTWSGPIGLNLRGLMVIMAQSSSRPEEDFWDKTIALVAPDYMSYNSRLGYHYASVDARLSEEPWGNHVRFIFKGGAADDARRARRARFIAAVLERIEFAVRVRGDTVEADFFRRPREDTADRLDLIGRLMGCSRQRDMVMNDDQVVDWYTEAFLKGNYAFNPDE